jgi:uncharacterized protein (TIGR01777 family)
MPASAGEVFAWHLRPGALERLLPPWQGVRVLKRSGEIEEGARLELSVPVGPVRARWVAGHRGFRDGESFRDVQESGPFAYWSHRHRVEPSGPKACVLEDRIRYALPAGGVGDRLGNGFVTRLLDRTFEFRHERTRLDLLAHERYANDGLLRVLVSGARGLIGSELTAFLTSGGNCVVPLSRSGHFSDTVRWSPEEGRIELDKLPDFDAVVHLAGESVVGRWTAEKKRKILESRVKGTRLLCESLAALPERYPSGMRGRPKVLVCASATGFYGSRGDEVLTEESASGDGFLADVCRRWEAACEPARQAGIRVVYVRIGLVLTPKGGLLGNLLPLFRAGLGGRVGDGRQWMGWIAIDDLVDVFHAALFDEALSGPVNGTAPNPVTNAEFAKILGRVLSRPTVCAVPKLAVKAVLGEAADELALASARVLPETLRVKGHPFRYPTLEPALRFLLGR